MLSWSQEACLPKNDVLTTKPTCVTTFFHHERYVGGWCATDDADIVLTSKFAQYRPASCRSVRRCGGARVHMRGAVLSSARTKGKNIIY